VTLSKILWVVSRHGIALALLLAAAPSATSQADRSSEAGEPPISIPEEGRDVDRMLSEALGQPDPSVSLSTGARSGSRSAEAPTELPAYVHPQVLDAAVSYQRELYETTALERRYRLDTFQWQLFAGKVVFVVVLLIVGVGLVLSCRQVSRGWQAGEPMNDPTSESKQQQPNRPDHEFEASVLGASFKISSPALGVVILVVSLVFFHLYLAYVFPINVV